MVYAMLFPEPEKGGRGKKTVQPLNSFSKALLSQARAVLAYSPVLAAKVRDGLGRLAMNAASAFRET
jgi:hypothetical protein